MIVWKTKCEQVEVPPADQTHFYTIWISLYINKDYSSKMHERHLPVSYFVWKDWQEKVFSEHNWGLQNFIWANQAYVQAKKQMKSPDLNQNDVPQKSSVSTRGEYLGLSTFNKVSSKSFQLSKSELRTIEN